MGTSRSVAVRVKENMQAPFRYLFAILVFILALVIRWALEPLIADRFPFITLFPAIIIVARVTGFGPSVLGLLIGSLGATLWLPRGNGGQQTDFIVGESLFLGFGLTMAYFMEQLRQAKFQAHHERELLRITLTSMGDAVIATDSDGNVRFMNKVAEELTGWPEADGIGRPLVDVFKIVNEATRKPVESPVTKVLQEGKVVGLANHTVLIARDGTGHAIADSAAPIRDSSGEITGVVLVFRDNSANREEELRLLAADRQKNECLAMLGHGLRNPLAPIRSAVDLMQAFGDDPETRRMAVEAISSQTEHLTQLVSDLLDVSRIMNGRIALQKAIVPVATVIERALDSTEHLVACGGHHLKVTGNTERLWVEVDPVRLNQILVNLIHNACKYTPAGGHIELLIETRGSELEIYIKDNGIGIEPDLQSNLFKLFVQGERALDRAQGGLGIGLALSQTLARLHGGQISVRSEGLGKGSEFILHLPLLQISLPPVETRAPGPLPAPVRPCRILVVDDNRGAAVLLQRLLEKFWLHDVRTAADGEEALTVADAFQPELVFLDIGLPVRNGYEVARELRLRPAFAGVPLVAITGYGSESDRRQTEEAGFDAHLVKPVGIESLHELLGKFADSLAGKA